MSFKSSLVLTHSSPAFIECGDCLTADDPAKAIDTLQNAIPYETGTPRLPIANPEVPVLNEAKNERIEIRDWHRKASPAPLNSYHLKILSAANRAKHPSGIRYAVTEVGGLGSGGAWSDADFYRAAKFW
jgi:hypothetical protein